MGELIALPVVAMLHAVALKASLDVELLHLARAGGQCRPTCRPGRWAQCCWWLNCWPAVAVLPVVELVA